MNEKWDKKRIRNKKDKLAIPDFECVTNMFQYNIINQPTPSVRYETHDDYIQFLGGTREKNVRRKMRSWLKPRIQKTLC